MEVEYKKFTVVPDLEDGYSFEAYSTVKSFKKSEQAIYEWLMRIPAHRDRPFRLIVTADSGAS